MGWYFEPFRKYRTGSGRARRKEFWVFTLVNTIILFILGSIEGSRNGDGMLGGIFLLISILPWLNVYIRRMHDTEHSGIFILAPVYNLILACTEGTRGDNGYGTDPKSH
ncbi:MAG: hypothetical protein B1H09_02760 [Gemmatimonadaceae bacterium 4484_173]|nr:MAG: hypothetical protein B1H09_02760 [Gemmatimonadaceae bacterium 4484_173]